MEELAHNEDLLLAFFASIWTQWTSVRKLKEGETTNDLFGFLTTTANKEVGEVHPKAMPVILTKPEEIETWLTADVETALALQRPLPDGALRVVAEGHRRDPAEDGVHCGTGRNDTLSVFDNAAVHA
ncbi:MAG: SOS response-associated peptidase family protein [Paracoccaceae bacterium]